MKRNLLQIGIIIAIIALTVVVFVHKIQPTATDEEIREMIATQVEMEMSANIEPVTICTHDFIESNVVQAATCSEEGIIQTVCIDCNTVIREEGIPIISHTFVSKRVEPTCAKQGEMYDMCVVCQHITNHKTIEKLDHKTKKVVITERSCYSDGMTHVVCQSCNTIVDKQWSAQYNHQWIYVSEVVPTPLKDGSITYRCYHCDVRKTEAEKFKQKGSVNLCIPSQEINVEVFLGECNQTNTDKYDVSCDMNFIDNNNPLFFGHSTGTLRYLSNLQVGDYIYFTISGKTTTYKVTVSEEAYLINGGVDIQGKETGETVLSKKDKNTLHFFTCYSTPFNPDGRWIVFAEKV